MDFKKYSSIENTYNQDFINKIREEGFDKIDYIVQEKVHGACCSFVTDGVNVKFAKRTGFVEDGENFYGYERILEKYKDTIIHMFNLINKDVLSLSQINVFGELFGGLYPHPKISNKEKESVIQKGVFYHPLHEFYGFDIYIKIGRSIGFYLDNEHVIEYFKRMLMFYAEPLFKGTFDECLSYPNEFQSKIPTWLLLPEIEDNICEGVVIKPCTPTYLSNGDRILLKNKNEKFAERKQKGRRDVVVDKTVDSPELTNLKAEAVRYVTENRLNNVLSKIGEVSYPRDLGTVIGLMSKDVIEDFLKENSSAYVMLGKNEQKSLNKFINQQSIYLIKKK